MLLQQRGLPIGRGVRRGWAGGDEQACGQQSGQRPEHLCWECTAVANHAKLAAHAGLHPG